MTMCIQHPRTVPGTAPTASMAVFAYHLQYACPSVLSRFAVAKDKDCHVRTTYLLNDNVYVCRETP